MKEILYISGSELPSKYANSVHVMKMCQAFGENNIKTKLTARGDKSECLYSFYNVENVFDIKVTKKHKNNIISFIRYNYDCFKEIRKHSGTVYMRYLYPLIWVILFNKKVIVELHGLPKFRIIKQLFKLVLSSENLISIVFITQKLLEITKEEFNIPIHKCIVLSDCADIPSKVVENDDTNEIGYVGHLYEGRGVEIIIEMAKSLPHSNFHVIGGREEEVAKYKAISSNNIKYYGFVTQKELEYIYGNFSIALAPYQFNVGIGKKGSDTSKWMSPMKIFEYMSFKKAIIMSDLPVLHEVGSDGVHFIYTRPDDPQDWINAVIKLQKDKSLFDSLRVNSYKHFVENYTWSGRAEKILSIIDSY